MRELWARRRTYKKNRGCCSRHFATRRFVITKVSEQLITRFRRSFGVFVSSLERECNFFLVPCFRGQSRTRVTWAGPPLIKRRTFLGNCLRGPRRKRDNHRTFNEINEQRVNNGPDGCYTVGDLYLINDRFEFVSSIGGRGGVNE